MRKFMVCMVVVFCIWTLNTATAAEMHWQVPGMTSAGEHPRTLLLPDMKTTILDRLSRPHYAKMFQSVCYWASKNVDSLDDTSLNNQKKMGAIARAAAYMFYMNRKCSPDGLPVQFDSTEERMQLGEKAVEYMMHMYTKSRAKGLNEFTLDIHTAEELHQWADTLDLLLGSDMKPDGFQKDVLVQKLADLAADFYADYSFRNTYMLRALVNNHRAKSAAALGLAAIVLNGEDFEAKQNDGSYDPANWIDFAIRFTDLVVRDFLTDEDGGFQEGASYVAYSGVEHFPFMWAWHIYTSGADYDVNWDEDAVPYYKFHACGTYTVPDMWSDTQTNKQIAWLVKTILPDGTQPPLDDSTPGQKMYFGAFVNHEFPDAGMFEWAWEKNGLHSGNSVDTAMLILSTHDDSIQASPPQFTDAILPHAGNVVFRSGWDDTSLYVLFAAEHSTAAAWIETRWGDYVDGAAGHEHPDALSFMLYYNGVPLMIDSGYLGWENHQKVNKPPNHNVILIDGKGAQTARMVIPEIGVDEDGNTYIVHPEQEGGWSPALDGMGYLLAWYVSEQGSIKFARAYTEYHVNTPPTEIHRNLAVIENRIVVVRDDINILDTSSSHKITFQLHGNGGGTSGGEFTLTENGAVWSKENTSLKAVVLSQDPIDYTIREAIHDAYTWEERTHTVLDSSITTQRQNTGFLAVLIPLQDNAHSVHIASCDDEYQNFTCTKIEFDDLSCLALYSNTDSAMHIPATTNQQMNVSEAAFCMEDDSITGYFVQTQSIFAGKFVISNGSISNFHIHVIKAPSNDSHLYLPVIAGKELAGACSYNIQDDTWEITALTGADVQVSENAENTHMVNITLQAAEPDEPSTVELGNMVNLIATTTCLPENVKFEWNLKSKPELSGLVLDEDQSGAQLSLLPDLPGVYKVGLKVKSNNGTYIAQTSFEFEVVGELAFDEPDGDLDETMEYEEETEFVESEAVYEQESELIKESSPQKQKDEGCASGNFATHEAGLIMLLLGVWKIKKNRDRQTNAHPYD